jgi:hypothetical protein
VDKAVINIPGVELNLPRSSFNTLVLCLTVIAVAIVMGTYFSAAGIQVLREVKSSSQGRVIAATTSEEVEFSKTYVFWVPNADNDGKPVEQQQYDNLHKWLIDNMGGYTRWKVEGTSSSSGPETTEGGWFYQTSIRRDKPDVKPQMLYDEHNKLFKQRTLYMIILNHQKP